MRHRKAGRRFGMDASARKAMLRNMVTSLMVHGSIRTTEARAKELRRVADRVISIGKRAPTLDGLAGDELAQARAVRVAAIRRAKNWVNDRDGLDKVFGEYADRYATRPGGYTRVVKTGRRPGDNAAMAVICLVEAMDESDDVASDSEASAEE